MRSKWQWTLLIGLLVGGISLFTLPTWGEEEGTSEMSPQTMQRFKGMMGDMSAMMKRWQERMQTHSQDPQAREQMGSQMMQMGRMMHRMGQMMEGQEGAGQMGQMMESDQGADMGNPCGGGMSQQQGEITGPGGGMMGQMGPQGQTPEQYSKLRAEQLRSFSKWFAQMAEELEKLVPESGTQQELEQMEEQLKGMME